MLPALHVDDQATYDVSSIDTCLPLLYMYAPNEETVLIFYTYIQVSLTLMNI